MARFRKVASGWVNEKGVITLKLVSDLSDFVFNKSDKVVLFPNRKKISDKSPDFDFCFLCSSEGG